MEGARWTTAIKGKAAVVIGADTGMGPDTARQLVNSISPAYIEDVAAVVTVLCSKNASFLNGPIYRVDGGSVATV